MEDHIHIKGAKTHNLKNIDLKIPRNKMVVFTGLSGSGKSSLAFDTIFAEGQRRYIESLSAYARQFLRQMQKPDVEEITGLSPAISIDQKSRSNNPRSTVATITEIYDYMRILFARVGKPHCLVCGREIKKHSNEEIIQSVIQTVSAHVPKKVKKVMGVEIHNDVVRVFAPVVVGRKGEYYQMLYDLLGKGYEKAMVDGKLVSLRERVELARHKKHDIDALVDEILISEFQRNKQGAIERLSEAVERALGEADGLVKIEEAGTARIISSKCMCAYDGFSFPEVEPRLFSFNSPYGACPECNGLGTKHFFSDEPCPVCKGKRLRPEALNVFLGGEPKGLSLRQGAKGESLEKVNIVDLTNQSIAEAYKFFSNLELTKKETEISKVVIKEITSRLKFMLDVGLDYLTLDRRANTLSGGEAQRIRLASQLGSGLVGALYVLDEPTIGLHQRDNERLIKTLLNLRDLGNTIIVVEHDEDTIYSADYLVDIGPGAGIHGGTIVAEGWLEKLLTAKSPPAGGASVTLSYLRGEKAIEIPDERREKDKGWLKIKGG
ncbi:MAG: ABC-ATPase UvrA, partial [Patescibacteria group bacterium]